MEGLMIKVILSNSKVIAIASLDDDEYFYRSRDFEILEKGNHDNEE